MIDQILYPPIEPRLQDLLRVSEVHEIYYEESGNSAGLPVLVVHGGPGSASTPTLRRFFDPSLFRIILFDQRGCGQSRPHACLEDNDTQALVGDIEALRNHLGIARWLLFGGSWGSTLAMVYAQAHPDRVAGLILRGIFLGERAEINRIYQDCWGSAALFPDAWEAFQAPIPDNERHDMVSAYHRRLTGDDHALRAATARSWSAWEAALSHLAPDARTLARLTDPAAALAMARIETHYFKADCFLAPRQILDAAATLRRTPGVIVHGRYDAICPARVAWALHRAWPEAEFNLVSDAGHSALEAGIASALVSATDRFAASPV